MQTDQDMSGAGSLEFLFQAGQFPGGQMAGYLFGNTAIQQDDAPVSCRKGPGKTGVITPQCCLHGNGTIMVTRNPVLWNAKGRKVLLKPLVACSTPVLGQISGAEEGSKILFLLFDQFEYILQAFPAVQAKQHCGGLGEQVRVGYLDQPGTAPDAVVDGQSSGLLRTGNLVVAGILQPGESDILHALLKTEVQPFCQ